MTRYGGEEFALLLIDTSIAAAAYVSERLRVGIESCVFEARGERVEVTASFGVAATPDAPAPLSPESILGIADQALYKSKDAGRNCAHVYTRDGFLPAPEVAVSITDGERSEE